MGACQGFDITQAFVTGRPARATGVISTTGRPRRVMTTVSPSCACLIRLDRWALAYVTLYDDMRNYDLQTVIQLAYQK